MRLGINMSDNEIDHVGRHKSAAARPTHPIHWCTQQPCESRRKSWLQTRILQAPHLMLLQTSTYLWIATRCHRNFPPQRSMASRRPSTDTTRVTARMTSIQYTNSGKTSNVLVEKEINSQHNIGTYLINSKTCATHLAINSSKMRYAPLIPSLRFKPTRSRRKSSTGANSK